MRTRKIAREPLFPQETNITAQTTSARVMNALFISLKCIETLN